MDDETSNENVRLVQALAHYISRSAAPANVTVDQRLELIANIIEREAGRKYLDLVSRLHKLEINLHTIELRIKDVEKDGVTEKDLDRWMRRRIAWFVGILAGVATAGTLAVSFFHSN